MVILYILLGIAVIITLLLFLDVNLILRFEGKTQIKLRVLFFTFDVMRFITGTKSKKTKKKKSRPQNQTAEKPKKKRRPDFEDFLMFIDLVGSMVQMISEHLTAKLKVNLKKFKAVIASPEADKTAYMYGVICNAVSVMLDLIPNYVRKFRKKDENITVYPDYTAEKCKFEAHVVITLKVYHILIIAMRALGILNENARENIRRKGLKL